MKKLLLLFAGLLTSLGMWAYSYQGNGVKFYNGTDDVTQVVEVTAGGLAAWLEADTDGTEQGYLAGNAQRTKLVITGTMSADDFNAISGSAWAKFKEIDLSGVTVSDVSDAGGMSLTGAEYIHMPSNFASTDMQTLFSGEGYPNLKIAGSRDTSASPTEANFFQKDENGGNVYDFMGKYWTNWYSQYSAPYAGPEKVNMAGYYGENDLYAKNQWSNPVGPFPENTRYWDFTGATMLPCTVSIESAGSYGVKADGKKDNGEYITTATDKCTSTNALYYLSRYNPWEVVLPTGNTEIPPMTFYRNGGSDTNGLRKVTIPEGYTTIGFEAFYGTWLETVTLPSTITTVGNGAFGTTGPANSHMTEFIMRACKNDCTLGQSLFSGVSTLRTCVLGEGVIEIGYYCFNQCAALESVRIPSTCTIIDSYAFNLCSSLHSVTIPEGVRLIERGAFATAALTDIYVMATTPDAVPNIFDAGYPGQDKAASTFSKVSSLIGNNNNNAQSHADDADLADQDYATVLTWYQEDQSGGNLGLGNCVCVLHYPESMKDFYDRIPADDYLSEESVESWIANIGVSGDNSEAILNHKLNGHGDHVHTYLSDAYDWGSVEEGVGNESKRLGPTEGDLYWPVQFDYAIHLAAGGTAANHVVAGTWGWRQFALQGEPGVDDKKTYTKEYDETWYTMCFPWDMEDENVFQAFNKTCEIAEFVGAEVLTDDEDNNKYTLVLHFDEISQTRYMDKERKEYTRTNDGDPVDVSLQGVTIKKQYYIYTPKDGGEVIRYLHLEALSEAQKKAMQSKYLQIRNILVTAGHPYMIHPDAIGEPGSPAECVIVGTEVEGVTAEDQKVTRAASTRTAPMATYNDTPTPFVNPDTNKGGSYDFIGNIGDSNADMPLGSYFLAVGSEDGYYPKFYRKVSGGAGKWTQYTAIIRPDADALANIENLPHVSSANANVVFGEWEEVEADAIEEIVTEAEQKGQEVRQIYLNVVYNINGQVVNTVGNIEGLPKGLYIVNGKKYMVK